MNHQKKIDVEDWEIKLLEEAGKIVKNHWGALEFKANISSGEQRVQIFAGPCYNFTIGKIDKPAKLVNR